MICSMSNDDEVIKFIIGTDGNYGFSLDIIQWRVRIKIP